MDRGIGEYRTWCWLIVAGFGGAAREFGSFGGVWSQFNEQRVPGLIELQRPLHTRHAGWEPALTLAYG